MGHGRGGRRLRQRRSARIYVTGYGGNALYHNLGNCKFEDVTEKAGVAAEDSAPAQPGPTTIATATWICSSRATCTLTSINCPTSERIEKNCSFKGIAVQCGPWGMLGESDLLFHNRGDGTFEEVSKKAGVDDPNKYYGLGAIWGDYDNDGWPDLYVANDSGPNYLYHNKHDGTFEEVGMLSGPASAATARSRHHGRGLGRLSARGPTSMFVTNFTEQA